MSNISISLGPHSKGSIKLKRFSNALPGQIKKGFTLAGFLLEKEMKQLVSGPGRVKGSTDGPVSRLNDYPGVVTGQLRRSINSKVNSVAGGQQLRIGPNVEYAAFLEFGTKFIKPPLAFVFPTWEQKGDKAVDLIQNEIFKPLDR